MELPSEVKRYFVAYFVFNPNLNAGISLCFKHPNIEVHIPFGFFKIGWLKGYLIEGGKNKTVFGYYKCVVNDRKAKIRVCKFVETEEIKL